MLICPICQAPLASADNGLACANRHSFDRARQGYYNLLPVQHKKSLDPGDNAGPLDCNLSDDPEDVSRIRQVLDSISSRTGQYLALKTLVSVILGVISWVIMEAFGVEFAGFWAVLITVLNYVPYIGSFLGVLFPVAWGIVQFGDVGTVLTLLVLLSTAQFVIGNFLDPFLMGNSLNLSPFVILASLTIWGTLWGIPGAFLAVPITSVLAIVLSEFRGTRPIAVLMSRGGQLQGR